MSAKECHTTLSIANLVSLDFPLKGLEHRNTGVVAVVATLSCTKLIVLHRCWAGQVSLDLEGVNHHSSQNSRTKGENEFHLPMFLVVLGYDSNVVA